MKLNYHHVFRNLEGFLECNVQTYLNVKRISLINQDYCDNGKWLLIDTNEGKTYEILVKKDDEFEILILGE